MKEFFLVNNDIENIHKDGQWLDVSLEAIKNSAKITVPSVKLFQTRQDAERAALDGADLKNDTDFFPVIRVVVPSRLKGRSSFYDLADGTRLNTLSFDAKHVKPTDVYLSHLDKSYADVALAKAEHKATATKKATKEAKVEGKTSESRLSKIRGYLPSAKNAIKNGVPLAIGGLAWWFGNAEVASFVAKSSYSLPQAIAEHAWLPAIAGTTFRVAVEVPELAVKVPGLLARTGKNIASLCGKGIAKLSRKKADATAPAKPSQVDVALTDAFAAKMNEGAEAAPVTAEPLGKEVTHSKAHQSASSSPLRELIPQRAATAPAEKPTLH